MGKVVFSLALLISVNVSFSQSAAEMIVRNILKEQTISWNAGNLHDFMSGYWKSNSLMFVGKRGITYGWQQALDNYIKGYPDTAAMGKLNFELLEVKRLSVLYYFVIGKWHLTRSIGNLDGIFTLLFKKIKNKWVIIADHSS